MNHSYIARGGRTTLFIGDDPRDAVTVNSHSALTWQVVRRGLIKSGVHSRRIFSIRENREGVTLLERNFRTGQVTCTKQCDDFEQAKSLAEKWVRAIGKEA